MAAIAAGVVSCAQAELSVAYEELPLGSISPEGWLRENLELQRDNISADLDETYPEVMGSRNGWLGGDGDQWERGPYWIDGLLPLAYILDDESLKAKVQPWVEWALASQTEDGNFGPRTDYPAEAGLQRDNSLDWWPRMVMLKVLYQYYNATGDGRVIPFFEKYFRYQLSALKEKPLGHWTFWAEFRQADEMNIVLWLYRRTGEKYLLELADLLHEQGFDFVEYFENEGISRPGSIHCVNLAQGLKEPVVYWAATRDDRLLAATDRFFSDLPRFISYPTGMYGGDECLRDNDPTRGSELCSAVEFMYSLEEMMKITGNPFYAEYLERIAFNALEAQISDDFRLHQYYQQTNQVSISYGNHNFSIMQDGTANLMGFLTGYPCCLSNLHQGWPKFTQNLWLRSRDGGLAALAYSPCSVRTRIAGTDVTVREVTEYPYGDVIRLELSLSGPVSFPLHLRIPSWTAAPEIRVMKSGSEASVPGTIADCPGPGDANSTSVADGSGDAESSTRTSAGEDGLAAEGLVPGEVFILDREWHDGDVVELYFPMKVSVSRWFENSASIERGPLVYALDVEGKWEKKINRTGLRDGQEYWEVKPVSPWNWSLVYDDIDNPEAAFKVNDDGSITARAVRVPHWKEVNGDAAPLPYSPVRQYGTFWEFAHPPGEVGEIRLIPYGQTTLRITEFPVLKN